MPVSRRRRLDVAAAVALTVLVVLAGLVVYLRSDARATTLTTGPDESAPAVMTDAPVSPSSKVIVHLDRGNNSELYRWFFDQLRTNGGKYDVIGMSYYPYWLKQNYKESIANLQANLNDMASRYGKEVMVTEVGGEDTAVQDTYDMLVAVLRAVRAVPNGKGLGVFYWEPEGARSWSQYALSAWGADGKPTAALNAFLDKPAPKAAPKPAPKPAKRTK